MPNYTTLNHGIAYSGFTSRRTTYNRDHWVWVLHRFHTSTYSVYVLFTGIMRYLPCWRGSHRTLFSLSANTVIWLTNGICKGTYAH